MGHTVFSSHPTHMTGSYLSTPRATSVIKGIYAVMMTGRCIDRAFIVTRFEQGGYGPRIAEAQADRLIKANTDIQHWSRWQVWGTIPGQETYSLHPDQIRISA